MKDKKQLNGRIKRGRRKEEEKEETKRLIQER